MAAATSGHPDLPPDLRVPADHAPASANSISAPSHSQERQEQDRQQDRQERPDKPPASDLAASAYPHHEQAQSLPYTSLSAAVSTSSSPGPASPSTAGGPVNRSRSPSTRDRINDILETARQRAETVAAQASAQASASSSAHPTPYNTLNTLARHATFHMDPLLQDQSAPGAFQAGTYGTLGTSASLSSTGRPRSRKNADRGYQQEAAASAVAATTASGAASSAASRADSRAASRAASRTASRTASLAGEAPADVPWWKDVLSSFQSIELENKGSVARDHLALERTFLAWLRTSLAFASIGIAVTQLFRLNTAASSGGGGKTEEELSRLRHIGLPLGSTFLGISVLILFLGYHRFYQSQQWILQGKFPASRGTILLVSLMAFALMVTSLVIVVVVQPSEG